MKSASPRANKLSGKKVLHILTGSIAAYKAGDLIKLLRENGAEVTCVMTESAAKFITPLTLRAISGRPVYGEFFDPHTPYDVLHTSLADQCDMILAAPASANFIARLAAGLADDLASCIVLAARKPVFIAPAMNDQMYEHPLTQRNIKTLREIGCRFIEPIEGDLVCGKTAIGHISEPHTVLAELTAFLKA